MQVEPLLLANDSEDEDTSTYSFGLPPTEFRLENCATRHICSDISLFVTILKVYSIGFKEVDELAIVEGVGIIVFTITDSNGNQHNITIYNIIYLPSTFNNLISVSQ